MPTLKNRQRQIPNGIFFYIAASRWRSQPGSFDSVVQQLQNHLSGNPLVAKKYGWSTDKAFLERLVDSFNATVCQKMGWTDYYYTDGGGPPPKPAPPSNPDWSVARAAAAGVNTLRDWLGAGMKPVPQEQATARALICTTCPKNDKNSAATYVGEWTKYFTKPASEFITREFEQRAKIGAATMYDEQLEVCMACLCPLKLKIFCPIQHIKDRMPDAVKAELDPKCWVLAELK